MEKKSKEILLNSFYKNKKILITGANGFKGLWLSIILNEYGSKIYGLGIKAPEYSLFNKLKLEKKIKFSFLDIRNKTKLKKYISKIKPDIIFHCASQSLVTDGFKNPSKVIETNVLGLSNLFLCTKDIKRKLIINIITSDKCYNPKNKKYVESDSLGGVDIYSASKSCQEILAKAYYETYLKDKKNFVITTFRAGNVVGGGDFGRNRIFTDIQNSIFNKKKLFIRNYNSTRPWQHLFDCLNAYLITTYICNKKKINFSNWNVASNNNSKSVKDVISYLIKKKFIKKKNVVFRKNFLKESKYLSLNPKKIYRETFWRPKFNFEKMILDCISCYKDIAENNQDSVKLYNLMKNRVKRNFL